MTVLEILTPKMLDFIEQKLKGDYAYQLLKQKKKATQVLHELEDISVFIEFNRDQDIVWGEFNPHKKQITLNANMDLLYEPWGVQSYDDIDDDFEWNDDVGYGDYYTDEDKTLHTNKFEALLLHEVLHALHYIIGIDMARNYYMPDGEEYYHDQGEFKAFVDTMDFYAKHYPEMDFDELLNIVSLSHSGLSRKTMERAHEVAVSRKPPLQYQLQPKAGRMNWYKVALGSQKNVGYHATSYSNAMSILREGFNGSISPEYFEEHYYSFLADLSPENQEKVENVTPENWTGKKWDNAWELLANLWYEEHPDVVVVWVSPDPDDIFGDTILEVDLSDMEKFLDDYTYGLAYRYHLKGGEQRIPSRYFSLYEEEEEGDELV